MRMPRNTLVWTLLTFLLLAAVPASAAPRDTARPRATITTADGEVVTPRDQGAFVVRGRATDDRAGIDYVAAYACKAVPGPAGWTCGAPLSEVFAATTGVRCTDRRRRCTWSIALPTDLTPGVFLVTATATDRVGKTSRDSAPIRVVVARPPTWS